MKIYRHKVKASGQFSGRVEIGITAIDTNGKRMSNKDGIPRSTIRLEETTVDEVYQFLHKALSKAEGKDGN